MRKERKGKLREQKAKTNETRRSRERSSDQERLSRRGSSHALLLLLEDASTEVEIEFLEPDTLSDETKSELLGGELRRVGGSERRVGLEGEG